MDNSGVRPVRDAHQAYTHDLHTPPKKRKIRLRKIQEAEFLL